MKAKQQHIAILIVVAVLVAVSIYYIIPVSKTHLGLDLQGGLEVVYDAQLKGGGAPSTDQMDKTIEVMDRRINTLGVTESQIQQQGPTQISVSLPGVENVDEALSLLGQTAQLKFYDDAQTRLSGPSASRDEAIKQAKTNPLIPLQPGEREELNKLAKGEYSDKLAVITAPAGKMSDGSPESFFVYRDTPAMGGDAIKSARQAYQQGTQLPNVEIEFTDSGAKQFEEVTKKLVLAGTIKGTPQSFAIVLDDVMESDPIVDPVKNPNGISGGSAVIEGNFSLSEAKSLATVINTGALPVDLVKAYDQKISATLGRDSLMQGLFAGIAGLAIVLIYMLIFYRFLGLVADLALIIYAILLWGLFNAIPVTLTLPGIAGMILTIGVAADANVVIFERIKEEVRQGRTVRSAINTGYARGFKTILDANLLTLLTALVLFVFASAQVKGFAFTLILGVLVSMFTAVAATRAMLGLLSDYDFFSKASFMGVKSADIVPDTRAAGARPRRALAAKKRSR
jgi:preprotein translocase subunit SecD